MHYCSVLFCSGDRWGPLAVLLFLRAPWMQVRSGMFGYALRQYMYSKGSKRSLSDSKKRMVRGPSVFFEPTIATFFNRT